MTGVALLINLHFMINNPTSFLLLRLALGASMLGHGLVRLPKLQAFSEWMTGQFAQSMLPKAMVQPFSYVVAITEFVIGILLVTGLFTRLGLITGAILMTLLIFGCCLIEDWSPIPSQLLHAMGFVVLLSAIEYNRIALDQLFK
jgi:thiosulfate dehydrogenase [quinone] large subunit